MSMKYLKSKKVKELSNFERLSMIINDLHAFGRIISERELNMKNLRTLPRLG